jgi:hypothetical protein
VQQHCQKNSPYPIYYRLCVFRKPNEPLLPWFKWFVNWNLFQSIFLFEDNKKRQEDLQVIANLVNNTIAMVIALTTQDADGCHILIGCVIFHPDSKEGCFVSYVGVLNTRDDTAIKLNKTFNLPKALTVTAW